MKSLLIVLICANFCYGSGRVISRPNIFGGKTYYGVEKTPVRSYSNRLDGNYYSNGWYSYKSNSDTIYYKRF